MKTFEHQINALQQARRRAEHTEAEALENIERNEADTERMRGQVQESRKFIQDTNKAIALLEGAFDEKDPKSV